MMKYRRLLSIPIALVVIFCLTSCKQQTETKTNTLTVGLETDITTLDPIKTLDPHVSRIVGQVFEGLVGLNESNQVVPLLAESWTANTNYDVWIFTLRKGVFF